METVAPSTEYLAPSFVHATVGDAMRPWVLTCDPATPLVTVAQRMAGEQIHAIIVLTARDGGERTLHGVVTDADLLQNAARVDELTAADVAHMELVRARADERLADVAERMARRGLTHALVLAPGSERPIGVLSSLDVARILAWGRA
jgi:CBS domain-containing protein